MDYQPLGLTGLTVSRLCFGSLTMGPLQANLAVETGGRVLEAAFSMGINFVDTAESYDNYAHIRYALEHGWSDKVVVASKSYAFTAEDMQHSLEQARRELNRDYVDIFLLHEQESALTLQGHRAALEYLCAAKQQGLVKAVGISTHTVAGVRAGALSPLIDVIHPLINKPGIGIVDGTAGDMLAAIRLAHTMGKGIYGMKALAGGHLWQSVDEAFDFVLRLPELASVAVGMQSEEEVYANVERFSGRDVPIELAQQLQRQARRLHVEDWCTGCGQCVESCPGGALSVGQGRVQVDHAKCVFCGYCGRACPDFCLKVI